MTWIRQKLRRIDLRLATSIALGLILLGVFIERAHFQDLRDHLQDSHYEWLPLAILANLSAQAFRGLRHHFLLKPTSSVPVLVTMGTVLVGSAINNVLPLRAGDVSRVQLLAKRFTLSRSTVAATLAAEKVLDIVVMAAFLLVALLALDLGPVFGWLAVIALFISVSALLLAWLLGRSARRGDDAIESWLPFFPKETRRRLGRGLMQFEQGWWALWRVRHALPLFVTSAGIWLSEAVAFWLFGQVFGLDLSAVSYVALVSITNIVTSIAVTPAGVGAFQLSVSELLRRLGSSGGAADAFALASHAVLVASVMVAGGVALVLMRVRAGELLYLRNGASKDEAAPQTGA